MKIFNPSIELGQLSGSILLDSTAKSIIANQLTASYDVRYVLSGSIPPADWDTLLNRPVGVVSGSSQLTLAGDVSGTGNAVNITPNCIVNADINTSAGIVYTKLDFNGSGLVSGSSQITLESTNKTGFTGATSITTLGTVTSGNISAILPSGLLSGSSQVDVTQTTNYSSVVQTTGNQTIGGNKTFSGTVYGSTVICGTTICGGNICSAGISRAVNLCATTSICGPILDISGTSTIDSLGVGTGASGTTGEIRATNNITAYYSDCRLKENIKTIDNALNKIEKISGIYFTNNDTAESFGFCNKNVQVGVIAQEIESILPEIITLAPFDSYYDSVGCIKSITGCEYKTVYYDKIVPLLIQSIKELKCEIDKINSILCL